MQDNFRRNDTPPINILRNVSNKTKKSSQSKSKKKKQKNKSKKENTYHDYYLVDPLKTKPKKGRKKQLNILQV